MGDAVNVDTVRVEWPSGTVQELHNQAAKQTLRITEPPRLRGQASNGQFQGTLKGGRGFQYGIERSANLTDWSPLAAITVSNLNGIAAFTDSLPTASGARFYRATQK